MKSKLMLSPTLRQLLSSKIFFYTGKTTYNATSNQKTMKAVKVVKELVQNYKGLCCTVYIDCFYTLVELIKALDKMDLYITGTLMKNCSPKELQIPKSSKKIKAM